MNRLWVVESALTTTGAMADHRLALPSARDRRLRRCARAELGRAGRRRLPPDALAATFPASTPRWLAALAKDLAANRGTSLVVAGRDQPPAVHALALALNAALGNVGTTRRSCASRSTCSPPQHRGARRAGRRRCRRRRSRPWSSSAATRSTTRPPTSTSQAALGQGGERRPPRRSPSTRPPARATGTCPRPHFLEAWGDCRAADGTASVVQPLIAAALRRPQRGRAPGACWRAGEEQAGLRRWCARPGARCCRLPRRRRPSTTPSTRCCTTACSPAARCRRSRVGRRRVPAAGSPPLGGTRRRRASSSSSGPRRRSTTAASPTSAGCRSCPTRSPS